MILSLVSIMVMSLKLLLSVPSQDYFHRSQVCIYVMVLHPSLSFTVQLYLWQLLIRVPTKSLGSSHNFPLASCHNCFFNLYPSNLVIPPKSIGLRKFLLPYDSLITQVYVFSVSLYWRSFRILASS